MAESEELKSLLKVKEETDKVGLKPNIQKTKVMASGPITSWQIDMETMDTIIDFILGGSKITGKGDFSHEIIVMYGCESWTIKKAECWRIDVFKL